MSKTVLTNFDKFVLSWKYKLRVVLKKKGKFKEKFKGNFKNCWKNFQEIFLINKIRQILSKAYLFFWERKLCCNLEKMKIYKNFDELGGKAWKTIEEILRRFKKKTDQF